MPDPESDDPSATPFESWVSPHLGALAALARHEVGGDVAEDLVQETLLRAWRRRATYDPARGSVRAWLVAVLLDQARRHRTRSARRPLTALPDTWDATTDYAGRLDVESAVRRLAARQRQVVVLHYLADLPVGEVAKLLGISDGAVKAQLFDARANLRRVLGMSDERA